MHPMHKVISFLALACAINCCKCPCFSIMS
uniref:Uncharacterized protein n=1 Tax=Arundo donax TaxID=35708 RepID=A0A0A9BSH2_ARUDO